MALIYFLLSIFLTRQSVAVIQRGVFMGCYQDLLSAKINKLNDQTTPKDCTSKCYELYYRYALSYQHNQCTCTNLLGQQRSEDSCENYCSNSSYCKIEDEVKNAYFTELTVLGPPAETLISDITDTKLHIEWKPPEFVKDVMNYKIQAQSLHSYSRKKLDVLKWEFSNETVHTELNSLHPGTNYNVSVRAVSLNGEGIPAYQLIETKIGVPSNIPMQPVIINRDGMTMKVKLQPVENDNGPISSYLIVVVNKNSLQTVEIENLRDYREAHVDGLMYYVTAELQKERVQENTEFIIGDGLNYGRYYNAPLEPKSSYSIMLGVASRKNKQERFLFSEQYENIENIVPYIEKLEDSSGLIIALSIGIAVVSLLLIAGIVGFIILRIRISSRFRHRLQDVQELTMQGPMIDIENAGYISEDHEEPLNHYKHLKGQVWMIPHNSLNIDNTLILGEGKYGHIHKGILEKDNSLLTVSVYNIADKKLTNDQKYNMLKDMDQVIKSGKHRNVLEFIGNCEHVDTVSAVFESSSLTLKEFLIGSRIPSVDRFTTMTEVQAIQYGIDIANALNHLHSRKILHKQICARHVAIVNGSVPKLTGFGLTAFYKDGKSPNCVRWTAREVLKGHSYTYKSDIWSFACLFWEICTLGATPYTRVSDAEIVEKVTRGLLLEQPIYMDESLYQILLNCWQMDLDERPTFKDLVSSLESLLDDRFSTYLSFKLFNNFKYEPLQINQEVNNSVF